jgi:hypothetical protein
MGEISVQTLGKIEKQLATIKTFTAEQVAESGCTDAEQVAKVFLYSTAKNLAVTLDALNTALAEHAKTKTAKGTAGPSRDERVTEHMRNLLAIQKQFFARINFLMREPDAKLTKRERDMKRDAVALVNVASHEHGLSVMGNKLSVNARRNVFNSLIIFWTTDGQSFSPYASGWTDQGDDRGQYHTGRWVPVAKSTGYTVDEVSKFVPMLQSEEFYGVPVVKTPKPPKAQKQPKA